jgi:hypothetical protein
MKGIFFFGALAIGALIVAGAIQIQKGPDNQIQITVDEQKTEQVAEKYLHEGEQVLGTVEQAQQNFNQQNPGNYNR